MPKELKFKQFPSRAKAPLRASSCSANRDLFSTENKIIQSFSQDSINTDLGMAIAEGFFGKIAPRSGLTLNNGTNVWGGLIDSDFRGKVVSFFNHCFESFSVRSGDCIAQIVL